MNIDFSHRSFKSSGDFERRTSNRRSNLLRQGNIHRKRLLQEIRNNPRPFSPAGGDVGEVMNQTLTKFATFCVEEQAKVDGEVYTDREIQAYVEYLEETLRNDILAAEVTQHQIEQNRQRALDKKEALRFSREKGQLTCPVCHCGYLGDDAGFVMCKNGCGMQVGRQFSLEQLSERIAGLLQMHAEICPAAPVFKTVGINGGCSSLRIYCTECNKYEIVV